MKKTVKSILTALFVLVALAAGIFAFLYVNQNKSPVQDKQFDALQVPVSSAQLEKTDLDSIFYSEEENLFYEWDGTAFQAYPHEVRQIQLTLSGETLNFPLSLIQKDGVYFGVGRAQAIVTHYFVKAMNIPPCPVGNNTYNSADTLLLMLDSTKGDIPQAERIYGDAFSYRLSDGTVLRQYLGDRLRQPTETGVKRSDYFGFTTEMVQKSTSQRMHFLTRAKYEISDDPYRIYDLNSTEPSYYYAGYTADRLTLEDIILDYAYDTEGGVFHFKRGDGVFYSKIGTGTPEDQNVATFEGDYKTDYVRQGDYLIHTTKLRGNDSFTVTNARTGEVKKITLPRPYRDVSYVKMNEAKTKLAITGEFDWTGPKGSYNLQMVTFVDLASGTVTQHTGSALYDAQRPQILFSGDSAFLYCDGSLCKFDL